MHTSHTHSTHGPHTVSIFSLLPSLVFPLSLFFCPPSPYDVVCDVVLCCVWECMWCLWCVLWCGVVGGRGLCLVCVCGVSHAEFSLAPREVHQRNCWILTISNLRTSRTRHVPDSFNHSLYPMKTVKLQLQSKKPKKKQPLDDTLCLSPQETERNERFARQYRYEPPQENLLTLPFSRCVNHLWSPNTYALTQTVFKITENTHTCCHESSRTQPHFKK